MGNHVTNYNNVFTVQQLLDFIKENDIPMDAPIYYRRIEDIYFEKNGWTTLLKKGESYYRAVQWNADIDSKKYEDKTQYPMIKIEDLKKIPDEMVEDLMDEYIPVFSPCVYDKEGLYLDAHY